MFSRRARSASSLSSVKVVRMDAIFTCYHLMLSKRWRCLLPKVIVGYRTTRVKRVVAVRSGGAHRTSTPGPIDRRGVSGHIPAHVLVTDAIHGHGSLAAIELVHSGMAANNMHRRIPSMGPLHRPTSGDLYPIQSRRMTKQGGAATARPYAPSQERASVSSAVSSGTIRRTRRN